MPNRLQPLDLMSFVGGINLRRNQFQLAEDESPDLLNVDIDPRGGILTRRGWQRWNAIDAVGEGEPWEPRNAWIHTYSDGTQLVYVVNGDLIHFADIDTVFHELPTVIPEALPHGADFTAWGDDVYMVTGMFNPSYRRTRAGTLTTMTPETWSDVDAPTVNTMPQAEYITTHAGYTFVAVTEEDGQSFFSRIRWSHPSVPDAFREDDFLDIEAGGGRITGLLSFRDHLLIFKTNSMWALYGYDDDSWQLIKVSISVGCPSVTAIARSETAAFFFSGSDRNGVYAYTGEAPVYISEQLRPAMEEIFTPENVFVSWAGRRLWVSIPWVKDVGSTTEPATTFVFDPDVGKGAWTMYRSNYGSVGKVLDGSDINSQYPLAAFWSTYASVLVTLDYLADAYDVIMVSPILGVTPGDEDLLVTGDDAEISVTGDLVASQPFDSYYRTRWLHANWPDRKKSWRRPTFICREVPRDTDLIVEAFRDYDETTVHRTRTLHLKAMGQAFWTEGGYEDAAVGGFDWKELGAESPDGRGADWGGEIKGSKMIRGGSFGLARAVQMRVRASPNTPRHRWGVDGIVTKFVMRRFR